MTAPNGSSERPGGWVVDHLGEELQHSSGVTLDWMGVGSMPAFNDLVALVNADRPPSPPSPVEDGRPDTAALDELRAAFGDYTDTANSAMSSYNVHLVKARERLCNAVESLLAAHPSPGTGDDGSGTAGELGAVS